MKLVNTCLHHIDHFENKIMPIESINESQELHEYVSYLLHDIQVKKNKRSFVFRSSTTEVRRAMDLMLNGDFQKGSEINADRLLFIEKVAQEKYSKLTEIQKGILFQALIEDDGVYKIVITKADHNDYLDESDLVKHKGLPWKKKVFKAIAVNCPSKKILEEPFVLDTNTKMAKYWWQDYLELRERFTDSYNTETSLDVFDRKILNSIKKQYPADHTVLRNSVIGYFRSNQQFELTDFVDSVFLKYSPIDFQLPVSRLREKILSLPDKYNFDTSFVIQKESINKRKVENKIPLTDTIDLVIKDHISDLVKIIKAEKDSQGYKYIKIRTEEGYRRFSADDTDVAE